MSHKPLAKINRIAPETGYAHGPGKFFSAAFDDPLEYIKKRAKRMEDVRENDRQRQKRIKAKRKENTTH